MPKLKDVTGQKFFRLTAIKIVGKTKLRRESIWLCKCDCGRETEASITQLTMNSRKNRGKKSCGCWAVDHRSETHSNKIEGVRSGKLVAIRPTAIRKRGCIYWLCKCDCGKEKLVSSYNIKKGYVISCGCARLTHDPIKRSKAIREVKLRQQNRRRAKQMKAKGLYTEEQVRHLYEKQNGKCAICLWEVEYDKINRDHIMPLVLGGTNYISNIQITCARCNQIKNSMHPDDFEKEKIRVFL